MVRLSFSFHIFSFPILADCRILCKGANFINLTFLREDWYLLATFGAWLERIVESLKSFKWEVIPFGAQDFSCQPLLSLPNLEWATLLCFGLFALTE